MTALKQDPHYIQNDQDVQDAQDAQETEQMHRFWVDQPVVRKNEERDEFDCYVDVSIPVTAPPDQAAHLPAGFTWCTLDVNDPIQLKEIYKLLSLNYVEDSNHRFRFLYSETLLKWALTTPGQIDDLIFGVRTKAGVLAGFIAGIPINIKLNGKSEPWCGVNLLCVHSRLRKKQMAPVLISEMQRRVRLHKVYRAVFCGDQIPSKPFAKSFYKHRPINLKKLSDIGFYPITAKKMASAQKRFMTPKLVHGNVRPFNPETDCDGVVQLMNETNVNFKYDVDFTPDVVRHFFTPVNDVLYSYVIPNSTRIDAVFSFYLMNWSILQDNGQVSAVRAAYIWYCATTSIDLNSLIADLINKAANDAKVDIVNSLCTMGLHDALTANKFEIGDKELQFYSYNYAVPDIGLNEFRFLFI